MTRQPSSKFLTAADMPWREFDEAPGVRLKVLKTHPPRSADAPAGATLLLSFAPGSRYPAHRHPAGEEYWVLEGTLRDGPRSYGPGTYVYHPPGSAHTPSSDDGAVVLIFVPGGIELA